MLLTFLATAAILILVVAGASIGVMFKRQPIKGSCGGLDALGIAKACSCKTPCSEALERQAAKDLAEKRAVDYTQPQVDHVNSDYVANQTGEGKYTAQK